MNDGNRRGEEDCSLSVADVVVRADDDPGDPPQWVWHASSLPPSEIEKDGAVFPKGMDGTRPDQPPPNLSLYSHVQGTASGASRYDSGYVGTTTDRDYALRRITERFSGNGYLYRVHATPNFVDVAGTLGGFYNRASEHEYAAMGGFRYDQIMEWEEVSFGIAQPGESNAAYDRDRYSGLRASSGQPQLAGFPPEHAAWSQQPWRQFASCGSVSSPAQTDGSTDTQDEECTPLLRPYDEGMAFWNSVKEAGHVPDRWFTGKETPLQLVNAANGQVAENKNAAGNGAAIIMWGGHRGKFQQWHLERAEHNTYVVVNLASDKVLDGKNSPVDGEPVVQWERDGKPWQRWLLKPANGDLFRLVNSATGMALDLASKEEGAAVVQRNVTNAQTQTWRLRMTDPLDLVTVLLTNRANGKAIDIRRDGQDNGEHVVQWEPNGNPWQNWKLIATDDGTYVITSMARAKVLDAGDKPGEGTTVVQWDRDDKRPQKWRIELDDTDNTVYLVEVTSGLVVGNDDSKQDGAPLTLQTKNSAKHTRQKWSLEPVEPAS
ncbi:RICIN domain-containing protein [Streptomyces pathocidini]|uniref:RICIN domain-containing protein n=1 Tax=Streptomyces pathocidini TaxID=1650571 RepID=UPI0033FDD572